MSARINAVRASTCGRARCPSSALVSAVAVALALIASSSVLHSASREPVRASHGMVGSTSELASQVGVEILRRGGNAIDAAVAVGFALAVVHPQAGNIGGGGLMLIRFADGRETAIDYREVAPRAATRDMFLDAAGSVVPERSLVGPLAAGVPGTVAGLAYVHHKYGRLPWAAVVNPAIDFAERGFEVSWALATSLEGSKDLLARFPESARLFTRNGRCYAAGDRLVQPELAGTLRLLRDRGADAFYRGAIADRIVAEMQRSGGLISREDLARYAAVERSPIHGSYRGYGLTAMPPISSGGVALIEALNMLEPYPIGALGHNSSRTIHLVVEAERRAFADRSEWLGDPGFVKVPVAGLISKEYAERLRATIDDRRATPSAEVKPGSPAMGEASETTHYSVVDADGTAVATTTTLNGSYGNGQTVTGAGFLLNNEMDDFSAKPGVPNMFGLIGGTANAIEPGKRMLSSMAPTIVTKDGRTFLVVGSPGGSRIITTVLQVVMNVIDHHMSISEAVDAPRFHHQWLPDIIRLEKRGFPADVVANLEHLGHRTEVLGDMGDVHAILIEPGTGVRLGASDPRMDGKTIGY